MESKWKASEQKNTFNANKCCSIGTGQTNVNYSDKWAELKNERCRPNRTKKKRNAPYSGPNAAITQKYQRQKMNRMNGIYLQLWRWRCDDSPFFPNAIRLHCVDTRKIALFSFIFLCDPFSRLLRLSSQFFLRWWIFLSLSFLSFHLRCIKNILMKVSLKKKRWA